MADPPPRGERFRVWFDGVRQEEEGGGDTEGQRVTKGYRGYQGDRVRVTKVTERGVKGKVEFKLLNGPQMFSGASLALLFANSFK